MNETEVLTGSISINGDGLDFGADRAAAALARVGAATAKLGADSTTALGAAGSASEGLTNKVGALNAAYQKLTAGQQAQAAATGAQVNANKALEASQDADTAAAQRLTAAHRALGEAGGALTSLVTAPIIGLGIESVKAATNIDGLTHGLAAVLGSMDAATDELARIRIIGQGAGLGFEAAAKGVLGLTAAGLTVKQAEAAVSGFGKAVAEVGKGKDTFQFVQDELVRLAASSRVSGRSILELSRELPQLRAVLKANFGTSDPLQLEKLGIDSTKMIAVVSGAFNKIAIDENALKNRFDNASDTIQISLAKIGETTAPLAADFLGTLAPAVEKVSNEFSEMPAVSKGTVVLLAGLAAASGPVAMLANQFVALSQAAAGTQLAIAGPVGITAAIIGLSVALAGLGIAGSMNDESDKIMADAGKTAAQSLHERIATMKADVATLQGVGKDLDGFSDKFAKALSDNGLSFTAGPAGIKSKIDELNSAIQKSAALSDRLVKTDTRDANAAARRAAGMTPQGFDEKQDEAIEKTIDSLKQRIALFGDESERAKVKWEVFNGTVTKANPVLKQQAIDLAGQIDAMKKAADEKEAATKREEKFADAVRESNKQLALSRISATDPDAAGKKFDVEQEYAKPEDKLPAADAARIRANTVAESSEAAARKTRTDSAKAIVDANKKLEESIQSLREKQLELASGEEHLTHVQQAQIEIEKQRAAAGGKENADYERRLLALASNVDVTEGLASVNKKLAEQMDSLSSKMAEALVGQEQLTHVQQAQIAIDKLRTEGLKAYDQIFVEYILHQAQAVDVTEAKRKADEASAKAIKDAAEKQAEWMKTALDGEAEHTKRVAEGLSEMADRYDEIAGRTDYLDASFRRLGVDQKAMTWDMYQGVLKYADAWEKIDGLEKQRQQIEQLSQQIEGPLDHAFEATFARAKMSSKTFFLSIHNDLQETLHRLAAQTLAKAVTGTAMHAIGQVDPTLDKNGIDTKARSARNDLYSASSALEAAADKLRAAAAAVSSASSGGTAAVNNFATATSGLTMRGMSDAPEWGDYASTAAAAAAPIDAARSGSPQMVTGLAGAAKDAQGGNPLAALSSVTALSGAKGLAGTGFGASLGAVGSVLPWVGAGLAVNSLLGNPLKKLFHFHFSEGTAFVPGSGFSDSVPAMLTPGEMVLPRDVASKVLAGSGSGGGGDTYTFHNAQFHDKADVHRIRSLTNDTSRMKFRMLAK